MRSSDWSSDVCSSDLEPAAVRRLHRSPAIRERLQLRAALFLDDAAELGIEAAMAARLLDADAEDLRRAIGADLDAHARDRKRGVSGKSVTVRVDIGVRRLNKKTK